MLNIKNKRVRDKYEKFYLEHGYLPKYFDVYNGIEIVDIAPCITTASNGSMGIGTLLIIEEKLEWKVDFNILRLEFISYKKL